MMSSTSTPEKKSKPAHAKVAESPQARAKQAYAVIRRMTEINNKLRDMGVTSKTFAVKKVATR